MASAALLTWEDFIALMDAEAPKLGPRGPYRKKADNAETAKL